MCEYANRLSQLDNGDWAINIPGLSRSDLKSNPGFALLVGTNRSPNNYLVELDELQQVGIEKN